MSSVRWHAVSPMACVCRLWRTRPGRTGWTRVSDPPPGLDDQNGLGRGFPIREGRMLAINEDLLGPEAIEDPYTYYGRLREEDPIHWNPLYKSWVITRYDDVVWFLRHPEFFSSEIFLRDPSPLFPHLGEHTNVGAMLPEAPLPPRQGSPDTSGGIAP
jgi:hypothetical protein